MSSIVAVQLSTSQKEVCTRFEDIALPDSVQLTVVSDTPIQNQHAEDLDQAAEDLYDSLCTSLKSLGAFSMRVCGGVSLVGGGNFLQCCMRETDGGYSILVPVTGKRRIAPTTEDLIRDWIRPDPIRKRVVPILPNGASPGTVLPPPLNQIGVLFDDASTIGAKAPEILSALGVSVLDKRVFLSYVRDDTRELAKQLFEQLSHEGYKVYLDTASGGAGRPFPDEIVENLAQKAVMLLLESPNVASSRWTMEELAYATTQHLGLLALHLRGTGAPRFGQIQQRYPVSTGELVNHRTGHPLKSARLSEAKLCDFTAWFKRHYPPAATHRRMYMEDRMNVGLSNASLRFHVDAHSVYHAETSDSQPTARALHLTSRPPVLRDARRLDKTACSSEEKVIVGPHDARPPEDEKDISWLASEMDICLYPDDHMRDLIRDLQTPQLSLCR